MNNSIKILEIKLFFTTFWEKDDTPTERIVLEYNNNIIQIIRYNHSNQEMAVSVNDNACITDIHEINKFILENCA